MLSTTNPFCLDSRHTVVSTCSLRYLEEARKHRRRMALEISRRSTSGSRVSTTSWQRYEVAKEMIGSFSAEDNVTGPLNS